MNAALEDGLDDPSARRGTLAMIERALRFRWNVRPEIASALPDQLADLARRAYENGDTRSHTRCANILRAMVADNVAAAEALDKARRLDAGQAPEGQSITVVISTVPNREPGA